MVMPEAMAAGCLPVAFRGGGIPESVEHGESGFLWLTEDELKQFTLKVIRDDALRSQMADRATWRAEKFARSAFEQRILDVLAPFLYEGSNVR